MATDLEKLIVQLSADIKGYERESRKARGVTNSTARAIENRYRQMNKNLDSIMSNAARRITGPLAGIGAVLGTGELIKLTDTWTDLSSRVNLAAGSIEKGEEVMARLVEMARRTYSSLEQTAESYLSNATSLKELGYSTDQALDYTEALNNALVVSGAKGDRARSVIEALAKAMALGKLSGDELNTVITTGGRVAEALAQGLGVTVSRLRELGAQGKISGRDVVNALSSQMARLRSEAEAMPATISDGFQLLRNALLEYVGNADKAVGVSAKIAQALVIIADNFDTVADNGLRLAAVIAGALVGRSIAGMIAKLGLGTSALITFISALRNAATMAGLATAFAGLGAAAAPVGLVIGGTLVGALALFQASSGEAGESAARFEERLRKIAEAAQVSAEKVEETAPRYKEALKSALTADVETAAQQMQEAREAAVDLFSEILDNAPRALITDEQLSSLEGLRDRLKKNEVEAAEAKDALFALANSNPNFKALAAQMAPLLDRLASIAEGARQAKSELDSLAGSDGPTFREAEDASMEGYRALQKIAQDFTANAERRNSLTKDQLALETEIARVRKEADSSGAVLSESQIKALAQANIAADARRAAIERATSGRDRAAKQDVREEERRAEQWDDATQSIQERIQALQTEIDMEGKSVEATERSRTALELLNTAKRLGVEITPELRAEIDRLAAAYGQMAQQAHDSAETTEEAQRRLDEIRDIGRDAIHGIVDALEDGKLKGREFIDILRNIASQLLEMSVNGFLNGFLGKQGSPGGGLLGSLLSGFLGGGAGGSSAGGFTGFASGTANTGGGRTQVRGVVHGQEAVIPLPNGGRVPVDLRMPSMVQQPVRIDLRLHPTEQFAVDVDNRIDRRTPAIVRTSVQQSTRAAKEALPAMFADARARRM
ncbi:MAG: tape measure protein [Parvibaculaceae bacterium]